MDTSTHYWRQDFEASQELDRTPALFERAADAEGFVPAELHSPQHSLSLSPSPPASPHARLSPALRHPHPQPSAQHLVQQIRPVRSSASDAELFDCPDEPFDERDEHNKHSHYTGFPNQELHNEDLHNEDLRNEYIQDEYIRNLSLQEVPELTAPDPSEIRREAQKVQQIRQLDLDNSQRFSGSPAPELGATASIYKAGSRSPPLLDALPTPRLHSPGLASLAAERAGRAGHEPQQSRSSNSDASTRSGDSYSDSPRLFPQARPPRVSASRNSHRQSYYDFAGLAGVTDAAPGSALLPRLKTIDLYRKSARKTNDPELEFQLAQYLMQTALMSTSSVRASPASSPNIPADAPTKKDAVDPEEKLRASIMKESLSLLKRLAERGHPDAQYLLGDIYASSAVGKPDMEKSLRYFLMAAKKGHAESAYRAALSLQEGWGTSRDANRALQFYHAAAVRGQPGALYQLGMAYFYSGMGLPDNSTNRQSGIKWLSRAAKVGNATYPKAPHELAKIYEVGYKDIVIPDDTYAAKLYARSAELNYVPSAARLGRAYEYGELGCPQDPSLSIHYYTIAALGNDPSAQLSMCAWYLVGAGPSFPINQDEAYEWALRAALNGLPKAQYTVGFFLQNGIGCERNILESGKWYLRASKNGYEKATTKLADLGISESAKKKEKCILM